ncbi:hypothetical protein CCY99_01870 [Helicobacter sp. 16-1353]|uniref:DUF262 domain-containing protein n=1 Tax=Helicobacter sp. 16-1353 TaxID=2004996 RepID=UPI000DCD1022|nr:DUF262 domain-containing protein [Helicobacter sp. 16-1353]RAX54914.1 hypothetical protein CCY99_01870 [Helicobacter sp. 16-1353]
MEKIKAESEQLSEIFDDKRFYQVPDYQRPYSWDKEHVESLLSDLESAYVNAYDEDYFCGSLVLVVKKIYKDRQIFDVIDGQQRLTTFSLLACVIRDLYEKNLEGKAKEYILDSLKNRYGEKEERLRFLTDERYHLDYKKVVDGGIKENADKNKYATNAKIIKEFLKKDLSKSINENSINEFVEWLYTSVVLTVIICQNEDSAIRIFEIINTRGLPLRPSDILKARLMQKLTTKEDRNSFKTEWQEIERDLENRLDSMLTTYTYYKLGEIPRKRYDEELLKVFKDMDSMKIIDEIKGFAKIYKGILDSDNTYIYCLKYLPNEIYWISIVCGAKFEKYGEFDSLLKHLVAYYYQHLIAGNTSNQFKQTSVNIIKKIKEKAQIDDIKNMMIKNLDEKRAKEFKSRLEECSDSDKWIKQILLLAEYFSSDAEKRDFIEISNKLHLEHILPQNPKAGVWEQFNHFSDDDKKKLTHSLGNLTLSYSKKNIQASNDSFETKKEVYANRDDKTTAFIITRDILNADTWNKEAIETRGEKLRNKIYEIIDIF